MPSPFKGALARPLVGFGGFATLADSSRYPRFTDEVLESMRRLAAMALGQKLITAIKMATPTYRHDFASGINVIFAPAETFIVPGGYKPRWKPQTDEELMANAPRVMDGFIRSRENTAFQEFKERHFGIKKEAGLAPQILNGMSREAMDGNFDADKRGTVCLVKFDKIAVPAGQHPFIVLAHELIHSMHSLSGTHYGKNEEYATVGLYQFADDPMTENKFLAACNLPLRKFYHHAGESK